MSALFQTMMSRRTFARTGAALAALILAACSSEDPDEDEQSEPSPTAPADPVETAEPQSTPTPEPTATATPTPSPTPTPEPPEPISYALGDGLNEDHQVLVRTTIEALQQVADQQDTTLQRTDDIAQASVQIYRAHNAPTEAAHVHGEPIVAAVRTDHLIAEILPEDMQALLNGDIQNWVEIGGQDWIVHRAVAREMAPLAFDESIDIQPVNELGAVSVQNPGMIALIPRSAANLTLQTLIVDGVDPIRDRLSEDNWQWWERIDVVVQHDNADISSAIAAALDAASSELIAPSRTMVTVVGDVMLGRTPHRIMYERNDWRAPFTLVVDELHKGDLTIGNLECAITDSFAPPEDPTTFSLMTFTDAVEGLQYAGFDALSGANNHALDFGVVGMQDTTAALEAAGIQHFGTGSNLEEARQPCLLEYDGVTFAFLGYDAISMNYAGATEQSGGVAPLVQEYFVEDIQRAREIADVVIPYFHWGVEYTLTPTDNDRRMAHAAVDAGADLVLGGHPHWVQGMELYQGTAIFYSMANFIFDQEWSLETKQGFILHLIFEGSAPIGYRVVPVLIEDFYRPRIVEDDIRATILGRFWASSSIVANTPAL